MNSWRRFAVDSSQLTAVKRLSVSCSRSDGCAERKPATFRTSLSTVNFFEYMDILIYLETRGGALTRPALEVLAEGRRLATASGGRLAACVLGTGARALASRIRGPGEVHFLEDPIFDSLNIEAFAFA